MPLNDPTSRQLPPVPEPAAVVDFHISAEFDLVIGSPLYTAEQLQQCAEAAAAEERERAARVCEEIADRHLSSGRYVSVVADHSTRAGGQVDGATECATAIRKGAL